MPYAHSKVVASKLNCTSGLVSDYNQYISRIISFVRFNFPSILLLFIHVLRLIRSKMVTVRWMDSVGLLSFAFQVESTNTTAQNTSQV